MNYRIVYIDAAGGIDYKEFYGLLKTPRVKPNGYAGQPFDICGVLRFFYAGHSGKGEFLRGVYHSIIKDKLNKNHVTDFYSAYTEIGKDGLITVSLRVVMDTNGRMRLYLNGQYSHRYFTNQELCESFIIVEPSYGI
jgi:hypothetical protein